jgi:hypothetical protein
MNNDHSEGVGVDISASHDRKEMSNDVSHQDSEKVFQGELLDVRPGGEMHHVEISSVTNNLTKHDYIVDFLNKPIGTVDNANDKEIDSFRQLLDDENYCQYWDKIVYVLGYIGNEQCVDILIDFIKQTPSKNPTVSSTKYICILESCDALGLASQRSLKAFTFLKKGLDSLFWLPYSKGYKNQSGTDYDEKHVAFQLVKHSIHGIGASAREEVVGIIENLKNRDLIYLKKCSSSILQAVFYKDWIDEYGVSDFREGLSSSIHGDRWDEWKESNGELLEWYANIIDS